MYETWRRLNVLYPVIVSQILTSSADTDHHIIIDWFVVGIAPHP
jgi:hypothetical protein